MARAAHCRIRPRRDLPICVRPRHEIILALPKLQATLRLRNVLYVRAPRLEHNPQFVGSTKLKTLDDGWRCARIGAQLR
jgi:hypothetical protein